MNKRFRFNPPKHRFDTASGKWIMAIRSDRAGHRHRRRAEGSEQRAAEDQAERQGHAGTTADWIFPLPQLISYLSKVMTLDPGNIVTTGTPAGVDVFRNPQVFMQVGDVVEIEAEGIGVLRNRIVA
jgi:2-keto-4-pentenoate hydratase/2-oxohepta-3-ene-1,7-dioic acid hydratase in catechol pathway